jgi:hypothetical protein
MRQEVVSNKEYEQYPIRKAKGYCSHSTRIRDTRAEWRHEENEFLRWKRSFDL